MIMLVCKEEVGVQIRPYRDSDLAAVVNMSAQLGYPIDEVQAAGLIQVIVESPEQVLLVAEDERQGPIGWAHVFIARRIFRPPFADLGGLVVDEAARGEQVGAQLMGAAEAWAVERGCTGLVVRSNVIRQRAHRFYQRLGYDVLKQQVVFQKQLGLSIQSQP